MPELPDVEHMKKKLLPARGKEIVDVRVYERGFAQISSPQDLLFATIDDVRRRGKFILMPLSTGQVIVAHMGMTGELALHRASVPPHAHTKCAFELSNNRRLDYTCTRKLGMLASVPRDRLERIPLLGELGPEPLDQAFSERVFLDHIHSARGRIKPYLLNQRHIAGIGNLCADEILFHARIHPLARMEKLSLPRRRNLYRTMRRVLRKCFIIISSSSLVADSVYGEPIPVNTFSLFSLLALSLSIVFE